MAKERAAPRRPRSLTISGRVKVELRPTPRIIPASRADAAHAPARSQRPVKMERPMAVSRPPKKYMNQETHPPSVSLANS